MVGQPPVFSPTALAMGSLPIWVPGRCRGGFRTTGSGKVPGQVPGQCSGTGFREGSEVSEEGSGKVRGQVPITEVPDQVPGGSSSIGIVTDR